jgi:hypothetical protein
MRQGLMLSMLLTALSSVALAQTGTTYRFRHDTLVGTVWVLGDNARQEIEAGENGMAAGRIEIWKDGGKQVFVLNPAERTYYEANAYRAQQSLHDAAVQPLTVGRPFRVNGVEQVRVDLKMLPADVVSGYPCRRVVLTLAYVLRVGIEKTSESMPARVEGTDDFCVMDVPNVSRLPFHHGLELMTGNPQVDAAVAERLSSLKGIPAARKLTVTRRIESGEAVSATSVFLLSEIHEAAIPPDRFEVPRNYRFQEPVITPPVRKE